LQTILRNINPIMIIVFCTFIFGLINLRFKNKYHQVLLSILLVSSLTEFVTLLLISFNLNNKVGILYSISVLFHHLFWLLLINKIQRFKLISIISVLTFLLFGIINFFLIQGTVIFNYYSFIVGAMLYITMFFYESFCLLLKEDFDFIFSNNYLLLISPIIFFFGLSLMFAFVSKEVTQTIIWFNMPLYKLVGYSVNIIYYFLINLYIYKEIKVKNV
jgi:hypothetical protein